MTPQIEGSNANLELILALDGIALAMDEAEFRYSREEDSINATFSTDSCDLKLRAKANQHSLVITVRYSLRIPENRRLELLQFMNSCNWRMTLTNLEMDPEDGEIACRLSIPLDGGRLSFEQAERVLHTALGSANRHAIPILQIAFHNTSVAEALEVATSGRN